MAIRDDGSYPRMDNLLHEAPTRDAKGDDALPLGVLLPRPTTSDEPHVIKIWLWVGMACAYACNLPL